MEILILKFNLLIKLLIGQLKYVEIKVKHRLDLIQFQNN